MPPRWIVAQLDSDANWWVKETSDDVFRPEGGLGVMDAVQTRHIFEAMDRYHDHGLTSGALRSAFRLFVLQSEISGDSVRLICADQLTEIGTDPVFAVPVINAEGEGAYYDFLDQLTTAHIRLLNATHHYARDCSELDMQEELDLLDRDRYFSGTTFHPHDEIEEIISWRPAEWDDAC